MGPWTQHVVWITGGGTGLGKHMALRFAAQGAQVAVSGRRLERLRDVVEAIRGAGGDAAAIRCDVTDEASIQAALEAVEARYGRLDVVVANAGMSVSGPVERLSMDDWRRQFDTNVCGAAVTLGRSVPYLRETRGRMAIVGSVAAMVHFAGAAPYQASKAAVAALGATLAAEMAKDGISCTTLHPGFVQSDIYKVDNLGVIHDEWEDPRPAALVSDADRAARLMCRAILRRRREFVFTGHGRMGWFLGRHFPGLVYEVTRRIPNRKMKG